MFVIFSIIQEKTDEFFVRQNKRYILIPIIETKRLRLVPPSKECFDMYESFYADAEASKTYGGPKSKGEAWARLKSDLGSWHLTGFGIWIIQEKKSKEFVGTCGFWQGFGWPRELTWWLLPDSRGKGFAHEASLSVISYAYNAFGWNEVETYMHDNNAPAYALVEKLGGIKTRRIMFPDGLERNVFTIPKPA